MMSQAERQSVMGLSLLIALRMLGLFMVLPVISVLGADLQHATAFSLGLVVGIYGLSQAMFQIPLGALSDRIGRKPVVLGGLALFGVGALLAGLSENVWVVVFGRFLQGAGAISSTVMAWVADNTREHVRTKAMAVIGVCIGLSFALSLIIGPVLSQFVGLSGLFMVIFVLAGLASLVAAYKIPTAPLSKGRSVNTRNLWRDLQSVLKTPGLNYLTVSVLMLHATMTALFVVMPSIMVNEWGLPVANHWYVYLPVLALSFVLMVPLISVVEKRGCFEQGLVLAISAVLVGMLMLALSIDNAVMGVVALFVYFWGFNFLEAQMPSLVSRLSASHLKGTALGVFATAQFMGAFLGGVVGGWVSGAFGGLYVFAVCAILVALWWMASAIGASARIFGMSRSS